MNETIPLVKDQNSPIQHVFFLLKAKGVSQACVKWFDQDNVRIYIATNELSEWDKPSCIVTHDLFGLT